MSLAVQDKLEEDQSAFVIRQGTRGCVATTGMREAEGICCLWEMAHPSWE